MLSEALGMILLTQFPAEKRQELPTELQEVVSDQLSYSDIVKNSLDLTVITFNLHWMEIMVKQCNTGIDTWKWCIYRQWYTQLFKRTTLRCDCKHGLIGFFFFSINFRTFYLETLKNIHKNYPSLKELLGTTGLSGQYQDCYAHRTAIDQCDKQTIDRDAKTSGKILFSLCMFWINLYNTLRFVMSLCFAFFA